MNSLRLVNGRVFTGNPRDPWAEAVLITGGRIAWVGRGEPPAFPGCRTVDLGGSLVLPGLVDAHVHFLWYALGLDNIRMTEVASLSQVLSLVAHRVNQAEPGEWIVGDSYNHNVWGLNREPNRCDLDQVAPHNPVV